MYKGCCNGRKESVQVCGWSCNDEQVHNNLLYCMTMFVISVWCCNGFTIGLIHCEWSCNDEKLSI